MTPFPRPDYAPLRPYSPDRRPVEVDLSDNTNQRGPHPAAARVLREADGDALARYPSVYADGLKAAVARRFDVPEACVTTGSGADGMIDHALRAAAGNDGFLAYPSPTFVMVEIFARLNALRTRPIPWGEVVRDPGKLLDGGPAALYLCSPNNPTGAELGPEVVRTILEAAGPTGPPIFLDEAYAEFAGRSMIQEAAESDRLVVFRTFSKAYGLAGLRVGYAVGPAEVVAEIEKSRGPYGVSGIGERAAAAALRDEEGWVEEGVAEVVESRARLRTELEARGLAPLPSAANFVLLPVPGARGDAVALALALRERGVSVRAFPALEGVGDALRISVGPWRLMKRFLEALDSVLAAEGEV